MTKNDVRLICFYLPQFYPIPENDIAWGKGYTEWRRVVQAKPLFEGHYQPRLPADLGFYDLRMNQIQVEQAELAKQYGVSGFCYYLYWFGDGRRLLEKPLNQMVESGQPDFPYCVCWANPPWFANWVGRDDCLVKQEYSEESALRLMQEELIPMFKDKRYITVDGKPLFIVYVSQALPDPLRYAQIWRQAAREAGFEDIYLCRVENNVVCDPKSIGFDAAIEFPPSGMRSATIPTVPTDKDNPPGTVYDFEQTAFYAVNRPTPDYKFHRGVFPAWDNSARRPVKGSTIFHGSTPETYGNWLAEAIEWEKSNHQGDERLVFINAWNEWGESAYLEPDLKYGHAYLEATKRALESGVAKQQSTLRANNYRFHKRELSDLDGKKLNSSKQIVGSVDQVWKAVDKLCVAGWGCDLEEPSKPVQVLLFEDDRFLAAERTFISRPDVAQSVNAQAAKTGFHIELNSSAVTKASSLQVVVVSQKTRYNALAMNKNSLAAIK